MSDIAPEKELVMHLDLAGLAALMKALEAAMAEGRGRLSLGGGGISVRTGTFERFATVTLTFDTSDDGDPPVRRDPRPAARTPALALHS